jgi:uncharacterized protein (TIGR00730 family)
MLKERLRLYFHFLKSMLKLNYGLLVGMWKLTELPQPSITIFGGTRLHSDDKNSMKIHLLAEKLALDGFSILTGGGPGLMESANLAAEEAIEEELEEDKRGLKRRIVSMGIGVENLQPNNRYLQKSVMLPYFFSRKWLLVRYSVGFIVGPGGFGTLDELAEIITLIQTRKMPRMPLVLFGTEYWQPFMDWIQNRALRDNLILDEDKKIIYLTDDVDDAFNYIKNRCTGFVECAFDSQKK